MDNKTRFAISFGLILATLMQALDTTIANIALPYMQGSVSASQDEIAWVLTSYIVVTAIMTPPVGFLANRFGIRRVLLVSITGFVIASMLCGAAQSLSQIVVFRCLQGAFGAAINPLTQTTLFNIYPPEKQGRAMSSFGIVTMAAPVIGPVLGGWLTADFSWRAVFYINIPLGLLALTGVFIFLPESKKSAGLKLDWIGFGTLSLAIGALQVLLDRGTEQDWFSSPEIIIEAVIAGIAFYLFLVQTFTSTSPFIRPAIFRDRNFLAGTIFTAFMGVTMFAAFSLQPPFLQELMNEPIVTSGLVMGPRGLGTVISMLLSGRLIGKLDTRLILFTGMAITCWSFYAMSSWSLDVSVQQIAVEGFVQGFGQGMVFIPLTTVTLATMSPAQRPEGASVYNLSRNLGQSIGVSIVNSMLSHNVQVNHANIANQVTAFNRQLTAPHVAMFWNPFTAHGRAALDAVLNQQAQMIAYNDDYKFLMYTTLSTLPLLFFFKKQMRPTSNPAPNPGTSPAAKPA